MAGDSLIERYLASLDNQLASRKDRADLVAEVGDHLYSAAEHWQATGIDGTDAERRALQQFGRTDIAASLVTVMPAESTKGAIFFSRHLGALAAATSALWLVVGLVGLYGRIEFHGFSWPEGMAIVAVLAISSAVLSTTATLIALNIRAVGEVDDAARAIGLIGIVASFMALTMPWLAVLWASLFTLTLVWTFARTWRTRAGSRASMLVVMVVLLAITAAIFVVPIVSGAVGGIPSDPVVLILFFAGAVVLTVGFADIAARTAYRSARARALIA
ncbi:hypothetical protein [Microbacterium pumilum]|uniref:DUF1700 domain-containing protein n=1 Tax=Microbacterium pumilum TaxID=344165 RepID=A0ABP5DYL3_9MICO